MCILEYVYHYRTWDGHNNQNGVAVNGCYHQDGHAGKFLEKRTDRSCGTFTGEIYDNYEFMHHTDLTGEQMETISALECKDIFDKCQNCLNWEWNEWDEVVRPDGRFEYFPGHCTIQVQRPGIN